MQTLKGTAWTFGAHVNTDDILPAQYLNRTDRQELARVCFEIMDPDFASQAGPGNIIVAGPNFGCGSSREHAPVAIKAKGIPCIIAHSFARIFFRNAFNIGLPLLESPRAASEVENGHQLEVDLAAGRISNLSTGQTYECEKVPQNMLDILAAGGLMEHLAGR
jgi:3-isopropylmalate/(R)-2-methylmalate dehydratase small subunit